MSYVAPLSRVWKDGHQAVFTIARITEPILPSEQAIDIPCTLAEIAAVTFCQCVIEIDRQDPDRRITLRQAIPAAPIRKLYQTHLLEAFYKLLINPDAYPAQLTLFLCAFDEIQRVSQHHAFYGALRTRLYLRTAPSFPNPLAYRLISYRGREEGYHTSVPTGRLGRSATPDSSGESSRRQRATSQEKEENTQAPCHRHCSSDAFPAHTHTPLSLCTCIARCHTEGPDYGTKTHPSPKT